MASEGAGRRHEAAPQPKVLDDRIRELVKTIESAADQESDEAVRELIARLRTNLQDPEVQKRYAAYREEPGAIGRYPTDSEGFAVAYDPLEDEESFWKAWSEYGVVVGKDVVPKGVAERAVKRMHEIVRGISDGRCELDKPETWKDAPVDQNGIPFMSRGFFEVYHDKALSDIRQSVRLYIHHVLIWGTTELWSSFDRLGVKLPGHDESRALPLHVDQNPRIHADFKTVQGVLALVDCPAERGTFVGVPGSRSVFDQYGRFAPERGEFVELVPTDPIAATLSQHAQPIPLRAGCIVSWDSRTTHANTENVSDKTRYVAYVAAGPAREAEPDLIRAREDAFRSGVGSNVREALMHASKKARYADYDKLVKVREPEQLTLLGRLLYGWESYGKIQ
jgi:ectoine hydroxylase-related dioxygenase (phytanoyl-CoA dioxygenase family)